MSFIFTASDDEEVRVESCGSDDSDAESDSQVRVMEPCRFYNKGHCRDGDACPYRHVCKFALSGKCKYGSGCRLNHPGQGGLSSQATGGATGHSSSMDQKITDGRLYQWQLRDSSGWKDVANDHVIEAQYCLPHTKGMTIYNTKFGGVNIDFNAMRVRGKKLGVRRLDDGDTEWVWYCTLYNKWIKYGDRDPDGNPSQANSSDIEEKFQSNPSSSFTFNIGAKTFEIRFGEMQQVSSDRKRKVTRRPLYRQRQAGVGVSADNSVSQNAAVGTRPQWQFEGGSGTWQNFKSTTNTNDPSGTSDDIEKMFQDPSKNRNFKVNGNTYSLDFGAMTQTNLKTKKIRKIRRVLI